MPATDLRFSGRIAGYGTTGGVRIVLGLWSSSPFGSFADAMIEDSRGKRLLLAPTQEIGDFISSTYTFDDIEIGTVGWTRLPAGLRFVGGPLDTTLRIGGSSPLGRALRVVPKPLAVHPTWLRAIDPVARVLQPGARTAGSAGNGRREYYGVTGARRITAATASWSGTDLGTLAPLAPAVRFGFGSAPADPHIVDIVTTVREPG